MTCEGPWWLVRKRHMWVNFFILTIEMSVFLYYATLSGGILHRMLLNQSCYVRSSWCPETPDRYTYSSS